MATSGGATGLTRRSSATTTATTTAAPTSARNALVHRCQRMVLLYARHAGRRLHVGERQLDKGFAIELVLLERERHVERGLVLGQVVVAFGGAPGDRAEDAPVLLERHLQVPFFQL